MTSALVGEIADLVGWDRARTADIDCRERLAPALSIELPLDSVALATAR